MKLCTLPEWLDWITSIHISEIELGLDRVKAIAERLALLNSDCPVIIVGGTNGKGSTVEGLRAIYQEAGYRVGTFTSPILFKHNEYVRINGVEASDADFCNAYQEIENMRGDISLTPFEFHTLAALIIFKRSRLDVMILEVGLGGRLDATNIVDPDVAIVTSVDIDHVEWLGTTREQIGLEKAGIFRKNTPAICGDPHPPQTLIDHAREIGAIFYCQGKDFHFSEQEGNWLWEYSTVGYQLPVNALALQNMSTVLMAVTWLQKQLPVSESKIKAGLSHAHLPGRIQIVPGDIPIIYDVSHNPAGVKWLAYQLKSMTNKGKTYAVFSMLADKDIAESVKNISEIIDFWYIADLYKKRSASIEELINIFKRIKIESEIFPTIQQAFQTAQLKAQSGDRIVVFGSFYTVAQVMQQNR